MLLTLLLLTALSLILSVSFTPTIRTLAIRYNFVDLPDNGRKVHISPIPRVGGVALAAAYFGALLATALFVAYRMPAASGCFAAVKSIAVPAFLIFLIGLADDIFNLKPRHKFAVQIVAAIMVAAAGVHIHGIGTFNVHPTLETLGTIVWLVACTNALNLIDGLDGLAAGIAFLATLTTLIASLMSGDIGLTIATLPLAAALLGFLVFNFNPASIFLGDSGSLLLGFLLGCFSIMWSGKSNTALHMAAPLMALAVPLADTTLAVLRRFLRTQPIFKADRSHIHHRLLARGLSHRRTVLLLYAAATVAGSLALCLVYTRGPLGGIVIAVFVGAMMFGLRQLAYDEFDALRKTLLPDGIRREIAERLAVRTFDEALAAAVSPSDCWAVIQVACDEFGMHAIRMELADSHFYSDKRMDAFSWTMHVTIPDSGWIELSHNSGSLGYNSMIGPFVNTMRQGLASKISYAASVVDIPVAYPGSFYETATSLVI
jgi:UDP-GlcNAc:undecaprenyl-phosphate GlcNAc-1-phosphate transferase